MIFFASATSLREGKAVTECLLASWRRPASAIAAALSVSISLPPSPTAAHELIPPIADPREPNAVGIGVGTTSDYLGSDDYFVGAAPMIRLQKEGTRQSIGLYGNAEGAAASGLGAFEADAGARDARLAVYGVWPITKNWAVGAGIFYQRLLGDAADSPITADRGSPNQWLGGVGLGYAW